MKRDPIFGQKALEELEQKVTERLKPFPKMREGHTRLRIRHTKYYKDRMRYLYTGEQE
jgi:hypothetical protein